LQHVDCEIVSGEIYRCLKPGGIAYFLENSARNPLVRWARSLVFGNPGRNQRQKRLFFQRRGTADEYPLKDVEIAHFTRAFRGQAKLVFDEFVFFQLIYAFAFKTEIVRRLTLYLDTVVARSIPHVMIYSYDQHLWMQKKQPTDAKSRCSPFPDREPDGIVAGVEYWICPHRI